MYPEQRDIAYCLPFFRPFSGPPFVSQSKNVFIKLQDSEECSLYLDENYLIVAAIDFGTTYCGYGFAFKGNPKSVFMNKDWKGSKRTSVKAPTSVLVGPDNKFIAFGFDAEERYGEIQESDDEDSDKYSLFKHFKLVLHKEKLSKDSTIEAVDGRVAKAMDIFVMTLNHLKKSVIETVQKSGDIKIKLNASDIRWVITVPAIWKDEAKSFMRHAAFKAGCIPSWDSKKLLIALEPEAASLHCLTLKSTGYQQIVRAEGNVETTPLFLDNAKYMVIDGGGGTVDMTVHKLLEGRNIEEIYQSVGGICGSIEVDKEFEKLLTKAVGGPDFINYFKATFPGKWMSVMRSFELKKINFHPENNDFKLRVELPHVMFEVFEERSDLKKKLRDEINNKSICGITGYSCKSGCFVIDYETTMKLFKRTLSETTKLTKNILDKKEVKGLSHIIMVGGFADCLPLQNEIKKMLQSSTTLLVPLEPHLSVLKGAIEFGLNPYRIQKRIARMSYGTDRMHLFKPEKHDKNKKKEIEGKEWCDDIFDCFIKKGESVHSGKIIQRKLTRVEKNQKYMTLDVFRVDRSELAEVEYVDGEGMQCVRKIYIPLSQKQGAVMVKIVFGTTEVHVIATEENSGKTIITTEVDFLSYQDNNTE